MKQITISVPGKIHVIGEHTVVYGKPALLSAINRRVFVTIKTGNQKSNISGRTKKLRNIIEPLIQKKYALSRIPSYDMDIYSQIPSGSGLGSSAAVSAAYTAALLEFLEIPWDKEGVNQVAFAADKIFNGNPSGGDNTAVVYGGMVHYQKEKGFLNITQNIPHSFFLINSGKPDETTAEMVEKVAIFSKQYPHIFQNILQDQELLTHQMKYVLEQQDIDGIFDTIQKAQENLESIGVVSEKAKLIMYALKRHNIAAKISGAGGVRNGSGMILCLAKDPQYVINFARENNLPYKRITVGQEGLRREV